MVQVLSHPIQGHTVSTKPCIKLVGQPQGEASMHSKKRALQASYREASAVDLLTNSKDWEAC